MANHPSALKRNRQNLKRRERNAARRSRVQKAVRKLREAITKKDIAAVKAALPMTISEIMKAMTKGVIKRETAQRKVGRLSRAAHKAQSK